MAVTIKSIGRAFLDFLDLRQASYTGIATVVLLVSTPITGYGVAHSHGLWVPALLTLQSLFALTLWGIPSYKIANGTLDGVQIIAEERTRISDVLDMLMEEMASLAHSSDATFPEQRARVQSAVLTAAANLIGPDRTRCCFFMYERVRLPSRAPRNKAIWRARLRHSQSVGRPSSGAIFVEGTPTGDAMLKIVREGATDFVKNVDEDPPAGWDPAQRGPYKTFISIGVRAKTTPIGLLTVDAMKPGDLTEEDQELLHVFGWILATAHTMGARLTPKTPPTIVIGPQLPPAKGT